MRSIAVFSTIVAMLALPVAAGDDETRSEQFQGSILLHASRGSEDGVGFSGLAILPEADESLGTWTLVTGPRLERPEWWSEILGGVKSIDGDRDFVLLGFCQTPVRGELFNSFVVAEWTSPLKSGQNLFTHYELTRRVGDRLRIGFETELQFQRGRDTFGVGPQVSYAVSEHVTGIAAYQLREAEADKLFVRFFIDF